MKILDINEYLTCFNYEYSAKRIIELARISKEQKEEFTFDNNRIRFTIEGRTKYTLHDYTDYGEYQEQE